MCWNDRKKNRLSIEVTHLSAVSPNIGVAMNRPSVPAVPNNASLLSWPVHNIFNCKRKLIICLVNKFECKNIWKINLLK